MKPDDLEISTVPKNVDTSKLPITNHKTELCKLIEEKDVLLVIAETGSGKSTQIPVYAYETLCCSDNKKLSSRAICVTQPRRVAAISVAKRVSVEMGCSPGTVVSIGGI